MTALGQRANPSAEHEWRVALLEALAALTGHIVPLPTPLADGSRPDVLMADLRRCAVFLGDGKETEGPTDLASRARLERYLSWLAGHVRLAGVATIAVCAPSLAESRGWAAVLSDSAREQQLAARVWAELVIPGAAVVSARLTPGTGGAARPSLIACE